MRYLLLTLVLLCGCGGHQTFKPSPLEPTPEQMRVLLDAPVVHPKGWRAPKPVTFHLAAYPMVVLQGQAVRLTCYVPEGYGPGTIMLGLLGRDGGSGPIEHIQTIRLVENMECGEWTAVCAVDMRMPTGKEGEYIRVQKREEKKIQVRGGMCDSGDK